MAANWWDSYKRAEDEEKWWESYRREDVSTQDAGGGRGFVNPPMAYEPQPVRPAPAPAPLPVSVDYGQAATDMVGTPTAIETPLGRSVLDMPDPRDRTQDVGFMLRPEFVERVRSDFAKVPADKRREALIAAASGESGVNTQVSLAAQRILAEVKAEDDMLRREGPLRQGTIDFLVNAPPGQPAAPKRGSAPPPAPQVNFPDMTPTFSETLDMLPEQERVQQRLRRDDITRGVVAADTGLPAIADRADRASRDFEAEEFARNNPKLAAFASGAGQNLSGLLNSVPLMMDFAGRLIDKDITRAPNAPGVDDIRRTARSLMPKEGQQRMEDAWDKGQFGTWLGLNLIAQAPQMANQMIAALAPATRPFLLPAMGAMSAGSAYADGDSSLASVLKGGAEIVGEKVTLGVFDKAYGALSKLPLSLRAPTVQAVGKQLAAFGGAVSAQTTAGALEEATTQVIQNGVDRFVEGKDTQLLDRVAESAVLGAFMEGPMAVPYASRAFQSGTSAFNEALQGDIASTRAADTDPYARALLDPQNYQAETIRPQQTVRAAGEAGPSAPLRTDAGLVSGAAIEPLTPTPPPPAPAAPPDLTARADTALDNIRNATTVDDAVGHLADASGVGLLDTLTPPAPPVAPPSLATPNLELNLAPANPSLEAQYGLDQLRGLNPALPAADATAPAPAPLAAPRPSTIRGTPVAQLTDDALQQIVGDETAPPISRRSASIELTARQTQAPELRQTATTASLMAPFTATQGAPSATIQDTGSAAQTSGATSLALNTPAGAVGLLDTSTGMLGGDPATADARARAQRTLDRWATETKQAAPIKLGTATPEEEAAVNQLAQALGSQFGSQGGGQIYAFSDPKSGVEGLTVSGMAFVNTAAPKINSAKTALHEFKHVVEQIADAETKAGMTGTAAQQFTQQIESIFDDISDPGKRAYVERFLHKEELDGIFNLQTGKGTGTQADREARLAELVVAPTTRKEMTADFLGNRAPDKQFWRDLAQQDPQGFTGFVQKWIGIVDNLLGKLKGNKGQNRDESARVDTYVKDLQKAKMVAREALIAYSKSTRAEAAVAQGQQTTAAQTPAAAPTGSALALAQSNNTFTGQALGAGRSVGMTQPKGTPVEKLFSNFADMKLPTNWVDQTGQTRTREQAEAQQSERFREGMFARANKNPQQFAKDPLSTQTFDLGDGVTVQLDTAKAGNTRVQMRVGGDVVAAAGIQKGMVDAVAVPERFKGQEYGAKLLGWVNDNGVANIEEVPDRSPGFVAIQKKVLSQARGQAAAQTVVAEATGQVAPSSYTVEKLMGETRRFASGLSSIGDLKPSTNATGGAPLRGVGVVAGNLSRNGIDQLAHAVVRFKTSAFVDSGAFSAFTKGKPVDFDKILAKYDQLTTKIGQIAQEDGEVTDYPRPLIVMPDVVGDQTASIALIEKHKNWINGELAGNISRPIIPIQKGQMPMADAYRRVVDILGTDKFIVGIPSNAEAVTPQELETFLRDAQPKAIHILGAAANSKLLPRLKSIVNAGQGGKIFVTADASPVRSQILKDTATGKPREAAVYDRLVEEDTPANTGREATLGEQRAQSLTEVKLSRTRSAKADQAEIGQTPQFSKARTEDLTSAPLPEQITYTGWQNTQPREVPMVPASRNLNRLVDRLDSGQMAPAEFEMGVRMLAGRMANAADAKQHNRSVRQRERGADLVREKLLAARRRGDVDPDTTEFALWALDQNPAIATGLGFSVRTAPEGAKGSAGDYNPLNEVARVFKGSANQGTAVHEILHHSERMMPREVQQGVSREWSKAYSKALKNATGPQREALRMMLDALAGSTIAQREVRQAFRDGVLDADKHYQLTNPSEYWAVNATRILNDRFMRSQSWVGSARQWLTEMLQKAKGLFGLRSDAPVLRGLEAVLSGDGSFQSQLMLSEAPQYNALVRQAVPEETEISTQNPQAVNRLYNPIDDMLSIDEAAVREAMALPVKSGKTPLAESITNAILGYGFVPRDTPRDQVIEVYKQSIVSNLMYLFGKVPKNIRERSKLWYDGANRIATDMGKVYGVKMEQVAGIMAAMSPQKDWFQNVSMAERALDILTGQGNKAWDDNMLAYAKSYVEETRDRKEREKRQKAYDRAVAVANAGTVLNDMNEDDAAVFIRSYDEAYHSRQYRIVTPEGGFGDLVRNADGTPSTMMWSTYDPIVKSVSIFRDGSRKNISEQLGEEHKIRSFYNNIAAPNSPISHVTIDTHAVAAGHFEALAGTDKEVTDNFGGTGGSSLLGVGGTYGIVADAYRTAAQMAGVSAREMQSITWEAVRGLFGENIKSSIKPKVREVWSQFRDGKLSFAAARRAIVKIAEGYNKTKGGILNPDWVGSGPGQAVADGGTSYDKNFVPEGGVRLRESKELREKVTINLSAATSSIPGLKELYARALSGETEATELLQQVAESSLRFLLGGTKARLVVAPSTGVYMSDREPSISIQVAFDESESKPVLAALAAFADSYNQQQIHVRVPTIQPLGHEFGDGSYATPVYEIDLQRELSADDISAIIADSGLKGFTVTPKTLTAYWVQPTDGAQDADDFKTFRTRIARVQALAGQPGGRPKQRVERLYAYGEGDGARVPYSAIRGDVRTKADSDLETPRLIAEYLNKGPVRTFAQKPLTAAQTKEQKQLAQIFEALPSNDLQRPIVRQAYDALASALKDQFQVLPIKVEVMASVEIDGKPYPYWGPKAQTLVGKLVDEGMTADQARRALQYLQRNYGTPSQSWKSGLLSKIKAMDGEPYANSAEMRRDVSVNNRFRVYKTAPATFGTPGSDFSAHPLLQDSGLKDANGYPMLYNDLLRAVHDYFAHNLSATQFGPTGEAAAWRNHMASTQDPMARWALTAETRLQNAWQNFRPGAEKLTVAERGFAEQKAALPPVQYTLTGDAQVDAPMQAFIKGLPEEDLRGSLPPDAKIKGLSFGSTPQFSAARKDSDTDFETANSAPMFSRARPSVGVGRDELGYTNFGLGAMAYERASTIANNVLDALSNKTGGLVAFKPIDPKLNRAIRKMRVEVEKTQNLTANVAQQLNDIPEDERKMISDVIEGELKVGVVPPQRVLQLAASMSQIMSQQSAELVRLGMLTPEAAQRWDNKYLPRFYEQKLGDEVKAWAKAAKSLFGKTRAMAGIRGNSLKARGMFETVDVADLPAWQAQGWEIRDADYDPATSTDVRVWRDFTRDERDNMGEIRDAMFRFVMGYMGSQRDVALGRLYERLEAEVASRTEKPGYVLVPKTLVEDTVARRYGSLAGKWVPREVMDHLSALDSSTDNEVLQLYKKGLAKWKEGKTVLNPVAHANNIISNLTMAHFAGVSYWDADKYAGTVRDLMRNSVLVTEAKDAGLFGGTFNRAELVDELPPQLRMLAGMTESKLAKGGNLVWSALSFFLNKPLGKAYDAEDKFFRFLIYREARGRGLDIDDAVDYAQRFIFTYDDLPKGARAVRDFGLPFFGYTYKVMPVLAQTAMEHPLRMAAPMMALSALNAAMYAMASAADEDDDWAELLKRYATDAEFRKKAQAMEADERKNLPEWMRGNTALGTPKTVRLGMDATTGLPMFLDVSRMVPAGDIFDVNNQAGGIPIPAPFTPNNPVLTTLYAMLVNKDSFRGKELVDKNDTSGEAAEKRSVWLWRQFAPAIAVGNYHFDRTVDAIANVTGEPINLGLGEYTGIGRDGLPVQPGLAALQTVGVKARPIDLELSERMNRSDRERLIKDMEAEIRQLNRLEGRGAITPDTADKQRELQREKIQRVRDRLTVNGSVAP